jgi:predicted AlkP superfamily pyrophosphatase or phosphodiesterase
MEEFCLPDYNGGSIVNLMSSISSHFNAHSQYSELKILPSNEIKSKNVVLLVLDGLGYEYLIKNHSETLLNAHLIGSMTSVFPPTTASAITTFLTGVAPQQHAVTGWFMNLKEIGTVTCILPFTPRYGKEIISKNGVNIKSIIDEEPLSSRLKAKCFVIQSKDISHSDYSLAMSRKAKILDYKNLDGMFKKINVALKSSGKRKYIYSYWPDLDHIGHEYGINSRKAAAHLKQIDKKLAKLIRRIKGTNTTLIITADHGHMVTSKEDIIDIRSHPKINEFISMPFCGEKRSAYCYVRQSKATEFEDYIKTRLSEYTYLFKSEEFVNKNLFGLFKPNSKLFDRIGDYILVARGNFAIRNPIVTEEKKKPHIGHHAGLSREEMLVPLIVINC